MNLFERILASRGLTRQERDVFLSPDYAKRHDPFLLPDMRAAVDRLKKAHKKQERIAIYGDYDIDGLTATTLLIDALASFGFKHVTSFIPNRFVEGYGLTVDAIEKLAADGAQLIITVDCGSLSHKEIARANELGVDVIVTDHHNVADTPPPAIATINPKRSDHSYPFIDLPGVGVAFKLVQALQTELDGLPDGQEKWLLDLVALGTVCDVVSLVDENRINVYWGLKVLQKGRRKGLKALMAVSRVESHMLNTRSLGFALGPRMNAAGRLETAQHALDLLISGDGLQALEKANLLDELNQSRRADQDAIFKEAKLQAELRANDPVLVVSGVGWNHGIVGIVAAKLLEKFKKPTFVFEEMGPVSKGSARSYGDFSVADAIKAAQDSVTKGGGHKLAAGVTLPTENIELFRRAVNAFYKAQKLSNQEALLLPRVDVTIDDFSEVTDELIAQLAGLEPFGNGNPEPVLEIRNVVVIGGRRMGAEAQHIKLELQDSSKRTLQFLAFSAPEHFFVEPGEYVTIRFQPNLNEWNGRTSVEGRLLHLEVQE